MKGKFYKKNCETMIFYRSDAPKYPQDDCCKDLNVKMAVKSFKIKQELKYRNLVWE